MKRLPRALVFGGTGTVGRAIVRGLAASSIPTTFTYHQNQAQARALAELDGCEAAQLDLRSSSGIRDLIERLEDAGRFPEVFIHAAAVNHPAPLTALSDEAMEDMYAVNCRSALVACQALAPMMKERRRGSVVLLGALDRAQSLPIPVGFAATQGMLSAMVMAMGKELGPSGVRVNMVAFGILEEGLSRHLPPEVVKAYTYFSALRRLGKPEEVAKAVLWLALENVYMNGKIVPVNGGI